MKKGGGGGGGGERAVAKGGGEEGVGEGVAVERETGRQTTASRRGWLGFGQGCGWRRIYVGSGWPMCRAGGAGHTLFSFLFHFISFFLFLFLSFSSLKQFSISKYSNEKRYLRNQRLIELVFRRLV